MANLPLSQALSDLRDELRDARLSADPKLKLKRFIGRGRARATRDPRQGGPQGLTATALDRGPGGVSGQGFRSELSSRSLFMRIAAASHWRRNASSNRTAASRVVPGQPGCIEPGHG